ncbi:MAG: hypothetical protein ACYDHH_14395 [Solirubrobacteraceae bacterium]
MPSIPLESANAREASVALELTGAVSCQQGLAVEAAAIARPASRFIFDAGMPLIQTVSSGTTPA